MNKISKQLYLATLAVALATTAAVNAEGYVMPGGAPGQHQQEPGEHNHQEHEWQHSSRPVFLMHGQEHRSIEELLVALNIDRESEAAYKIKRLYGKAVAAGAKAVFVTTDNNNPGIYRFTHDQAGNVQAMEAFTIADSSATNAGRHLDELSLVGRRIHHPAIFYSDGIEVAFVESAHALPENVRFLNNDKMNLLLEKAIHEAGPAGFVYLLKLNDTGLYKLIYGNGRHSASFAELKLEGAEAKIFSDGQMSMAEVYRSPLIQRLFAQLKSGDPSAIKAQVEALPYVRGEEQRARISGRALQNLEIMEQGNPDDYSWIYKKQELEAIKRLLTKLRDFITLNKQEKQELENLAHDLDQRLKAAKARAAAK